MVVRWRDDETRPVVVEMSEVGIRDLDRVLVWLMDSEQPFMLGLSAGNVDDDLGLPDPEVWTSPDFVESGCCCSR